MLLFARGVGLLDGFRSIQAQGSRKEALWVLRTGRISDETFGWREITGSFEQTLMAFHLFIFLHAIASR